MQLHIDSDAAYLLAPKAKIRVAGYFDLSDKYIKPATIPHSSLNAPMHVEYVILKHVVSSAAEAETSGFFHNYKATIPIIHMLSALGYPQSSIPLKIDNATAVVLSSSTLKENHSKSWDMQHYWIKECVTNKQNLIYWDAGVNNIADYFTKHFSPTYHQKIQPRYILKVYYTSARGFVDIPQS